MYRVAPQKNQCYPARPRLGRPFGQLLGTLRARRVGVIATSGIPAEARLLGRVWPADLCPAEAPGQICTGRAPAVSLGR